MNVIVHFLYIIYCLLENLRKYNNDTDSRQLMNLSFHTTYLNLFLYLYSYSSCRKCFKAAIFIRIHLITKQHIFYIISLCVIIFMIKIFNDTIFNKKKTRSKIRISLDCTVHSSHIKHWNNTNNVWIVLYIANIYRLSRSNPIEHWQHIVKC